MFNSLITSLEFMHDEVQNESWVHEDETHNKHRVRINKSHTIKKFDVSS